MQKNIILYLHMSKDPIKKAGQISAENFEKQMNKQNITMYRDIHRMKYGDAYKILYNYEVLFFLIPHKYKESFFGYHGNSRTI